MWSIVSLFGGKLYVLLPVPFLEFCHPRVRSIDGLFHVWDLFFFVFTSGWWLIVMSSCRHHSVGRIPASEVVGSGAAQYPGTAGLCAWCMVPTASAQPGHPGKEISSAEVASARPMSRPTPESGRKTGEAGSSLVRGNSRWFSAHAIKLQPSHPCTLGADCHFGFA